MLSNKETFLLTAQLHSQITSANFSKISLNGKVEESYGIVPPPKGSSKNKEMMSNEDSKLSHLIDNT